jgi:hypothetical protein
MSDFDDLRKEVQDGMDGKNSGIPMGFRRLNNHIGIRKSMYYLIGGYTGSGKTALVDDAFVLNPLDYILKKNDPNQDMEILYFSMERRKNFKLAKWICRSIFLTSGVIISVDRMLGWVDKKEKLLTLEEHDLFLMHEEYIDHLMTKIKFIEGPLNPYGIKVYVDEYAKKNGVLNTDDKYKPFYIPNNPNVIVEIITDTVNLIKGEKDYPKGKPAIDKSSGDKQIFRDLYGYSIVDVSQFNRAISNPMRIKNGDVEPQLEDFKETSETQDNADVVLTLFDPWRYKVPDPYLYSLERLRDEEGRKKYRNAKILKNSYGSDDIRIGLAFQPQIGLFKEMPKKKDVKEQDYQDIIDNSFFTPNR